MPESWVVVEDYRHPVGWSGPEDRLERARGYCRRLERGEILLFRETPFELPERDREFLVSQRQSGSPLHKNISYRPGQDRLRGVAREDSGEAERAQGIMREYSRAVTEFLNRFLAPYAGRWRLDYASFRPREEEGRDLPLHKRNDLLHVDAFPSRPSRGARILRVFTNLNPQQARVWLTGPPFAEMAPTYAGAAGLRRYVRRSATQWLRRKLRRALSRAGLPVPNRSVYDEFMLHFHDWLKENDGFQKNAPHRRHEFPPGATWLVYTDGVPHAVLSGRFALEQTFMIPREALVDPESAPISVLEELSGEKLASQDCQW